MADNIRSVRMAVGLVLVAWGLLWPSAAVGVTRNWVAGDGDWTTGANWSPAGPPQPGDFANVSFNDAVARVVNFDSSMSSSVNGMTLDLTGSFSRAITLNMTGGNLFTTTDRIGNFGRGVVNQSSGYHDVGAVLTLGYDAGSVGIYNLTNDAYLNARQAVIGDLGAGTLTVQDNAEFRAWDFLTINSQGAIVVDGGTLTLSTVIGANRINFQSGTIELLGEHTFGPDPTFQALFVENSTGRVVPGKNLTVDYANVEIQKMDVDGGLFQASQLSINNFATNSFRVINGGTVVSSLAYIGYGTGGDPFIAGAVVVRGPGSNFTSGTLVVGRDAQIGSPDALKLSTLDIEEDGLVDVATTVYLEGNGIINLTGGTLRLNELSRFTFAPSLYTTGKFNFNSGTLKFIGNREVGVDETMNKMVGAALTITPGKEVVVEGLATLVSAVTLDGGTFTVGEIQNAHRLNLRSGRLNVTNQALSVGAGGYFASLDVGENVTINVDLGMTSTGLVTGDGAIGGTFANAAGGELRAQAGRSLVLSGAGNTNDGQIKLFGGELEFTQDLTNNAGAFISGNGSLIVGGGLANLGTMNFAGTANVSGPVNNVAGGKVISGGGGATIFYDDVVNDGEIRTSTNGFTVFFGDVSGSGTFTGTGTVNFEGDLNPGSSPAAVSFAGDVVLGADSVLRIELGGTQPGSEYDQLIVDGDLTLGGQLEISLIDGFIPVSGQAFDFLSSGSVSGAFTSISLPEVPGLTWAVSELDGAGIISAGLAGDFNNSGIVDAADYVVWRKGLGATFTQHDYHVWRSHYGASGGSGAGGGESPAGVPESAIPSLFAMAVAGLARARFLRQRCVRTWIWT